MKKIILLTMLVAPSSLYAGTITVTSPVSGFLPNTSSAQLNPPYDNNSVHQRIELGSISGVATVHAEFNLQNVISPENNAFGLMTSFSENLNQSWLNVAEFYEQFGNPWDYDWRYMGTYHAIHNVSDAISPSPVTNGNYFNGALNYGHYSASEKKYIFDFSTDFGAAGNTYLFVASSMLAGTGTTFTFHITGTGISDNHILVSAVPLPGALWLMGSGLLGLAAAASKRK